MPVIKNQTVRRIEKALLAANFNMAYVVDISTNYLEIFNGDACDRDGNETLAKQAVEITGLNHTCNIAYGGYMLQNTEFLIDSENRL